MPLADADSSGNPETHPWDYGFYWILDQMSYREPGELVTAPSLSKDGKSGAAGKGSKQIAEKPSKQGLGSFGRIAFEPQNRNFVGFYFDIGLVYTGLISARDEDELGIGFVYAQLSKGARRTLELEGSRALARRWFSSSPTRPFSRRGCTSKPDAQLIINPGGLRI